MEKRDKKEINAELKMMSAVSEAISLRKQNLDNEKVLKQITKFAAKENTLTQMAMIAAASNTLKIADSNPNLHPKEIIQKATTDLAEILRNIDKK